MKQKWSQNLKRFSRKKIESKYKQSLPNQLIIWLIDHQITWDREDFEAKTECADFKAYPRTARRRTRQSISNNNTVYIVKCRTGTNILTYQQLSVEKWRDSCWTRLMRKPIRPPILWPIQTFTDPMRPRVVVSGTLRTRLWCNQLLCFWNIVLNMFFFFLDGQEILSKI